MSALLLDFGGVTEREGAFPNYRYVDYYVGAFSEAAGFVVLAPLAVLFALAATPGFKGMRGRALGVNATRGLWLSVAAAALTIGAALLLGVVGQAGYFSWWLDVGFYGCLVGGVTATASFWMVRRNAPTTGGASPAG